ncbi:TPA: flagellar motor switch protein FliN [bacterium]|nr:flagellar motor switch protein FliN [bacterium]
MIWSPVKAEGEVRFGMVDGMLTQEEIDALLSGAAFTPTSAPKPAATSPTVSVVKNSEVSASALTNNELKMLGDRLNQGFGAASESAETLIGRKVKFVPISLNTSNDSDIKGSMPTEPAQFAFNVSGDASGRGVLIMSVSDAAVFADLLMGGTGQPSTTMDELNQSASKEAVSNILNSLFTSLGSSSSKNISAGNAELELKSDIPLAGTGPRIETQYSFEIEGVRQGTVLLVLENRLARGFTTGAAPTVVSVKEAPQKRQDSVDVKQVQFPVLTPAVTETQAKNIEILMDVPMQVTVELGRAQMMIRDILELGTGSIIELDKLAGEPVDLLVNSRLIARGEVVVIDENFGVRVTDIISPMERIKSLQG